MDFFFFNSWYKNAGLKEVCLSLQQGPFPGGGSLGVQCTALPAAPRVGSWAARLVQDSGAVWALAGSGCVGRVTWSAQGWQGHTKCHRDTAFVCFLPAEHRAGNKRELWASRVWPFLFLMCSFQLWGCTFGLGFSACLFWLFLLKQTEHL